MAQCPSPSLIVDIGIFAHNEAEGIAELVQDLSQQTIFSTLNVDARVLILANGCSDGTVAIARSVCEKQEGICFEVFDLEQGGKSRTAHGFIHDLSRTDVDILVFMDADIALPDMNTLQRMVETLHARPNLQAFNSRPVKDVNYHRLSVGPIAKMIAASGDGLSNWRQSICGQLYALRADMARKIGIPIGLPVEDGFMRAMIVTDIFSQTEDLSRIDGDPAVFHIYQSIRSARELLHHQVRLVLGSAVNTVIYEWLVKEGAGDRDLGTTRLLSVAREAEWLQKMLRERVPRAPYGYVPFRFMTKRVKQARQRGKLGLRGGTILCIGLLLDVAAWFGASIKMARGAGAGHW